MKGTGCEGATDGYPDRKAEVFPTCPDPDAEEGFPGLPGVRTPGLESGHQWEWRCGTGGMVEAVPLL